MNLNERVALMAELGSYLRKGSAELDAKALEATQYNPWFTKETIYHAKDSIAEKYLDKDALENWINKYDIKDSATKRVGLILAGNIPMVGFHDLLSVFIAGHKAKMKLSSKDNVLIPFLISKLAELEPNIKDRLVVGDKLNEIDALIATGSNSTGNYFEKYFGHLPNIIRKNRHAVAVIRNDISKEELTELGKDIFTYFGLGCRNVSKLYIEKGFDIQRLFDAIIPFGDVIHHHKYKNNYDYNNALYLLNKQAFLTNNFLIIRESSDISSRIASVHYEYFENLDSVKEHLLTNKDQIQCVVTSETIGGLDCVDYGQAQLPALDQYADGVDTMHFLTGLND